MMNSAFPPRASRTMGTNNNSQENHSSLALVTTSTKDLASPAGFPINRSPLNSIGINNSGGMGLRQRRPDSTKNSSLPPRASLTMMGAKASSTPTANGSHSMESTVIVPIADEYWVLAYGFGIDQREEALALFRDVGDVVEVRKGSRHSNWVAVSYDSALAAEQAFTKRGNRLSNGHIFGVKRLENSRKFFLEESQYGAVTASSTGKDETTDNLSRGLFPNVATATNTPAKAGDNVKEISDEDILMTGNKGRAASSQNKNVCELFMGWVYGW